MQARWRKLAAGAVLALALVAAGCGGGGGSGGGSGSGGQLSKSDYEQKMQAIGTDAKKSLNGLNLSNVSDLKEIAKQTGVAKDKLNSVADQVASLNAPDNAKADNAKMVTGLRGLADELGKLQQAANKGDLKELQKVGNEFSTSQAVKDADDAAKDLKKKGYNIGTFGQ